MLNNLPAVKFVFPLIIGIIIGWFFDFSVLFLGIVLAAVFLLTVSIALILKWNSNIQIYSVFILLILLGIFKITIDSKFFSNSRIDNFIGKVRFATFEGVITDPPRKKTQNIQFVVDVDEVRTSNDTTRSYGGILVSIPRENISDEFLDSLQYGLRISLIGELSPAGTARNPGDFDMRRYLFINDIYARMYLNDTEEIILHKTKVNRFLSGIVYPLRKSIGDNLDKLVGGNESKFIKGILIGDKSEIPYEVKESFINSGVMHILAVSGLHVGMITVIIFALLCALRIPEKVRIIGTCIILVFYVFLTGHPPSVVRATIMAVIILLSMLLERKVIIYNSLAFAAIILLFIDARQLFKPGFQLSFVAVISIVALYPKIYSAIKLFPQKIQELTLTKFIFGLAAVSIAAAIGTLPFTSYYFGKISIIGLIANLIIVPMTGIILALGITTSIFAFISFWVAGIFAETTRLAAGFLLYLVSYFGNLKYSHILSNFDFWTGALFYLSVGFVFTLRREVILKRIIFILLITVNVFIYYNLLFENQKSLKVTFLDVGQGDAIFLEFPNDKNMLVDAGPSTFYRDAGDRFIKPFLNKKGIRNLDYVLNTHPHHDHLGGLPALMKKFKVGEMIDAGSFENSNIFRECKHLIDSLDINYRILKQGTTINVSQDSRVYVLHPYEEFDSTSTHDLNNQSLVLKILYGNTSLLLTGDAERKSENEILVKYGEFIKSDLYKCGHHGSKTSNSEEFIDFINPEFAIISAGYKNKFNHPSEIVLERLNERNIKIHRTDIYGAVVFESDGREWKQIEWR